MYDSPVDVPNKCLGIKLWNKQINTIIYFCLWNAKSCECDAFGLLTAVCLDASYENISENCEDSWTGLMGQNARQSAPVRAWFLFLITPTLSIVLCALCWPEPNQLSQDNYELCCQSAAFCQVLQVSPSWGQNEAKESKWKRVLRCD